MCRNKKLFEEIRKEATFAVVVCKPLVFVEAEIISPLSNKPVVAHAYAKWNTQDMKTVQEAQKILKIYQHDLENAQTSPDKDEDFILAIETSMAETQAILDKYGWNEARGREIACGRAARKLYDQITAEVKTIPIEQAAKKSRTKTIALAA